MRGLSENFMNSLLNGILNVFLKSVNADDNLCLEIRENYINIYYRGGNIFKISEYKNSYLVDFNLSYCEKYKKELSIIKPNDFEKWAKNIPMIKYEMDCWFNKHQKAEREYQQVVLRENNNSPISSDTDYFIIDIEYADNFNNSRFDLIALNWASTAVARKSKKATLSFIEMKYGDSAISGAAGLEKHFIDMYNFLKNQEKVNDIVKEMENVFNQKIKLGLIKNIDISTEINITKNQKIEFILLLANHKPAKLGLNKILKYVINGDVYSKLREICDVKIATSCYMGYGLYNQYMINIEDFVKQFN